MPPIAAFIRWSDEQKLGLSFQLPMPIEVIAGWLNGRGTVSAD
jgi:hypothetical protein